MVKKITVTLWAEDIALIDQIKSALLPTDGKVSNVAIVRKAIRKLGAELK